MLNLTQYGPPGVRWKTTYGDLDNAAADASLGGAAGVISGGGSKLAPMIIPAVSLLAAELGTRFLIFATR